MTGDGIEGLVEIGGRKVGAFAELSRYGSNRILAIYPIPIDGGWGWSWSEDATGSLDVWGVEGERGQSIAEAYEAGDLPCDDRDEMNRILGGEQR